MPKILVGSEAGRLIADRNGGEGAVIFSESWEEAATLALQADVLVDWIRALESQLDEVRELQEHQDDLLE